MSDDALKRVRLWAEHGLSSKLSDLVAAVSHIDALEARVAVLEAALEFYADPEMWTPHRDASAPIDLDAGKIARAAIAAAKGA